MRRDLFHLRSQQIELDALRLFSDRTLRQLREMIFDRMRMRFECVERKGLRTSASAPEAISFLTPHGQFVESVAG